jgi:hypothetical protein
MFSNLEIESFENSPAKYPDRVKPGFRPFFEVLAATGQFGQRQRELCSI